METNKTRNYGIDLLRIIAVLYVITLHVFTHGNLLYTSSLIPGTNQYKLVWLLTIIAYCAVNIFALISGYVSYKDEKSELKLSKYFKLWAVVTFYSFAISLIYAILNPTSTGNSNLIVNSIFPVTNDIYWYFTAYTALFMIMPIINNGIRNTDDRTLKKIFVIMIFLFCVLELCLNTFGLNKGYSFIWITILYMIGAIIKKCEIGKTIKNYKLVLSIIALYAFTYIYTMYGPEFSFMEINITKTTFVSYLSPTILGVSILYLILFSKLRLKGLGVKIVSFVSPSAFSIYLLNDHPIVRYYLMQDKFEFLSNFQVVRMALHIAGFTLTFAIVALLINKVRALIFKIFKLNAGIDFIASKVKVNNLYRK